MSAAIALWNIVREAQYLLIERIIPLHGYVDRYLRVVFRHTLASRLKHIWMQYCFIFIDVFNKTASAALKSKAFFFASPLICQLDVYAIIQKR